MADLGVLLVLPSDAHGIPCAMQLVDLENPYEPAEPFILACERVIRFGSTHCALEEESWETFKFRAARVIHPGRDSSAKRAA
jgi:hypothetical protein